MRNAPVKEQDRGQQYAAAHTAHFAAKDSGEALQIYRDVMDAHPESQEAAYARSQIQNIAHAVVPAQEIVDARVELALSHLANCGSRIAAPDRRAPLRAASAKRTA